ncbi:hypothetical protein K440DRAFT_639348 [Wilcoxina mikolae CBS 423.85]|nr:hypothetical protein K440DRAFT_639348 [Wilcoxina mikolae CBS 423.85]
MTSMFKAGGSGIDSRSGSVIDWNGSVGDEVSASKRDGNGSEVNSGKVKKEESKYSLKNIRRSESSSKLRSILAASSSKSTSELTVKASKFNITIKKLLYVIEI